MSTANSKPVISESEQAQRMDLLRAALPECQPQEGSPANTFTTSELEKLRSVMKEMNLGPRDAETNTLVKNAHTMDIFNLKQWAPSEEILTESNSGECPQDAAQPQDDMEVIEKPKAADIVTSSNVSTMHNSWHGAPKIAPFGLVSQLFRQKVREGKFTGPTNGQCPGHLQCNLVVLPQGQHAFDFLLFCQRNKKACPLIEVCDVGSPHPIGVARGADLRTDVPK